MSRVEFANISDYSPPFEYEIAVKPEIYSMIDTRPSEDVPKTEVPSQSEDLPKMETSKSEISFGSDESSTLEEASVSQAFPGPAEPSNLEFSSVPEVEAESKYFLGENLSQEVPRLEEEPFLQDEEPQVMPLELLPVLHDPFAEVEAKLAMLSSTMAGADVPQADVPKGLTQVADVMQDGMQKFSGQSSAGDMEVIGRAQMSDLCGSSTTSTSSTVALTWWLAQGASAQGSGKEKLCLMLCKSVGKLGSRSKSMPATVLLMEGHLHGSLLCCHGYTELPGLRELEAALVSSHTFAGSEQRAGLGSPGIQVAQASPGTRHGALPPPRPSVSLLPFQLSFFVFNFFPSFFSLTLALPCLARMYECKEHRPLNQKNLGPDPSRATLT